MKVRDLPKNIVIYVLLITFALIFVFPYWWMVISSVRDPDMIFRSTSKLSWFTIFPESFRLDAYARILFEENILHYLKVSFIVAILTTVGALFVNSLAGYAFARLRFPGRGQALWVALMTFMFPVESTVIPLFIEVKLLGWLNTLQALVIPFIGGGFTIFFFCQVISDLPRELEDAARVDGCSWFGVYWRIILPQLRTAMISMGLLLFAASWNTFFWPLVATRGDELRVAPLKLALMASDMFQQGIIGWAGLMAAATILMLPLGLAFLFLQRYYVRGISMTGLR